MKCTCNSFYFDETKKKIIAQSMQHQQVNFKEKKDQFGAMKHTLTCHEQFNCIHPKAKTRENDYKKTKNTRSARNQKVKSDKK